MEPTGAISMILKSFSMPAILIILLAFNAGFVAGVCYYKWAHSRVTGVVLWLVSLPGLVLDAIDPTYPVNHSKGGKSSS